MGRHGRGAEEEVLQEESLQGSDDGAGTAGELQQRRRLVLAEAEACARQRQLDDNNIK